ncbi:MAG: ABC transporter substrate-binding protein [Anaerolineae bacterium]|nr:ABC transporter substrate-binding protein [Anaerolineae bacterium]
MANRHFTKWVLVAMVGLLLLGGCAKAGPKVYKVGLLSGVDAFNSVMDGFKAKMAELGYVEGETIVYDFQAASGDAEKMAQIARQFVENKVDLIVATTTVATGAAIEATAGTNIPVLFTIITDPVKAGVVESIKSPGGNITGIALPDPSYFGKRVEYLSQMAPQIKRLGILYDPDYVTSASSAPPIREVAASLGIELVETVVKSVDDLTTELDRLSQETDPGIDAILIMPDAVNTNSPEPILAFANEHKLPVAANTLGQTKQGALFSYAVDNVQVGRMAAALAHKILNGAAAGDLPVETAIPSLTINVKAAQTIGLDVPDAVLQTADDILY